MFLITLLFISMPVEAKPRKMAIFCVSFHTSSYCMSTETASARNFTAWLTSNCNTHISQYLKR